MTRLTSCILLVLAALPIDAQDAWVLPQLAALSPDRPEAYFLLAEELIAEPDPARSDINLARQLLVLAFAHSSSGGASAYPIRGSACLALASIETSPDRQRWLRALAQRVDARYEIPAWKKQSESSTDSVPRAIFAEAIGEIRAGRGRFALQSLEQPEVDQVVESTAASLASFGAGASLSRLRELAERYETPGCGGRRAIPEGAGARRRYVLCPENDGNPGPRLSTAEYLAYVRFEAVLLSAEPDSWAAELGSGDRAPLRDPEPEELAPLYGVDPGASIWRDGRWVIPPDA